MRRRNLLQEDQAEGMDLDEGPVYLAKVVFDGAADRLPTRAPVYPW